MEQALASCQQHWPQKAIYLGAQAHLQSFTPTSVLRR
jgi:ElaA protein